MRKGGGKAKGSSFERDVCRRLSLWVSNGTQEDVFWRSAMSGGRSTVAHRKGRRLATQAGDISCIHPIGQAFADKFVCECKFYADLDYTGLLTNRGKLLTFWDTLKKEGSKYNKLPFMIAKQNRQPATICVDRKGLDVLGLKLKCTLVAPKANLYIVMFDIFERWATRPSNGQ